MVKDTMGKSEKLEAKEAMALVVQHNDLVEAYYDMDLTVNEHKIIKYAVSKIKLNDTQFPDYSFDVKEFAQAAGVKGNNYHAQIERIADELSKKRIKVKSQKAVGWFPWFSAIVYQRGVVHISFNPLIKDSLLQLEEKFTNYPFKVISPLKSAYSLRLFELLKQYETIGYRRIKIEDLRNMLGINGKYPEYSNFKQRVIRHAHKELVKKTKLSFEFEEVKQGRKVVALDFHIKSDYKNEQLELFDGGKENGKSEIIEEIEEVLPIEEENPFVKEANARLKQNGIFIAEDTLKSWEKYGMDLIEEVIDDVRGKTHIDSYPAYLTSMLKKKDIAKKKEAKLAEEAKNRTPEERIAFVAQTLAHKHKNNKQLMPRFMLARNAIPMLMQELEVEEEEAKKVWEKHEDEIYDKVNDAILSKF